MKKLLFLLLAFPSFGFCDTKISALASTTTLNAGDIIPVVTNPSTSPANFTITKSNLLSTLGLIQVGVSTAAVAVDTSTIQRNFPLSLSTNTINILPSTQMVSTTAFTTSSQTYTGAPVFVSSVTHLGAVVFSSNVILGNGQGTAGQVYTTGVGGAPTWTTPVIGGASTLESFIGPARSSPTPSITGYTGDFIGNVIGGTTFQFVLNPATTDFIHNQTSLQTATLNVTSGTVNGQFLVDSSNMHMNFLPGSGTGGTGRLWAQGANSIAPSKFDLIYSALNDGTTISHLLFSNATSGTQVIGWNFQDANGYNATTIDTTGGVVTSTITASSGTFTNGVTVGSMTVNGLGNGVITLTINNSTYTVASSSDTAAIVAGHLAKWSTTNYTLIDGGVASSGSGTPAGNAYDVQVASQNLTQMAGYDNFQNNGTTVSVTGADSGQFINYSSVTYSGFNLFAFSGSSMTLDATSPLTVSTATVTTLTVSTLTILSPGLARGNISGGVVYSSSFSTVNTSSATTTTIYAKSHLSAQITPNAANSRIRITVSGPMTATGSVGAECDVNISTGGVVFAPLALNPLAVETDTVVGVGGIGPSNFSWVDSPNTASAITYTVIFKAAGTTPTCTFNVGSAATTATLFVQDIGPQ